MCHVSFVTCHVSRVTCHLSHVTCQIFFNKVVKLVSGGSVINGAYPVYFFYLLSIFVPSFFPSITFSLCVFVDSFALYVLSLNSALYYNQMQLDLLCIKPCSRFKVQIRGRNNRKLNGVGPVDNRPSTD